MTTQLALPLTWPQTDPREWALAQGMTFEWVEDWEVGSHVHAYPDAYDEEPDECLGVYLMPADGYDPLNSRWCIDDPTSDYRRQIESELAAEVMGEASAA